jgi:hypothetical protein
LLSHADKRLKITSFLGAIAYAGIWLLLPGGKHELLEKLSYPFAQVRFELPSLGKNA